MAMLKIGVDAYIETLHDIQREIIMAALEHINSILPIPMGLNSHALNLAVAAALVKGGALSPAGSTTHVMLFKRHEWPRLESILRSLPIRWQMVPKGSLHEGLNLIPTHRLGQISIPGRIRSIGFTNSALNDIGSKRLPVLKALVDQTEQWYVLANGGVLDQNIWKLEILFGPNFRNYVSMSIEYWVSRLDASLQETQPRMRPN